MKKLLLTAAGCFTFGVIFTSYIHANPNVLGINNPKGFPLYVIIEVNWDGESDKGDWTVWGPKYNPVVGTGDILSSCTECLDMNYDFEFKGKTLQFNETYVDTVDGRPQSHKVVLNDTDGDGVYTGALPAARYNLQEGYIYMDRIDYEVTTENGLVTGMSYLEYEHKKLIDK